MENLRGLERSISDHFPGGGFSAHSINIYASRIPKPSVCGGNETLEMVCFVSLSTSRAPKKGFEEGKL